MESNDNTLKSKSNSFVTPQAPPSDLLVFVNHSKSSTENSSFISNGNIEKKSNSDALKSSVQNSFESTVNKSSLIDNSNVQNSSSVLHTPDSSLDMNSTNLQQNSSNIPVTERSTSTPNDIILDNNSNNINLSAQNSFESTVNKSSPIDNLNVPNSSSVLHTPDSSLSMNSINLQQNTGISSIPEISANASNGTVDILSLDNSPSSPSVANTGYKIEYIQPNKKIDIFANKPDDDNSIENRIFDNSYGTDFKVKSNALNDYSVSASRPSSSNYSTSINDEIFNSTYNSSVFGQSTKSSSVNTSMSIPEVSSQTTNDVIFNKSQNNNFSFNGNQDSSIDANSSSYTTASDSYSNGQIDSISSIGTLKSKSINYSLFNNMYSSLNDESNISNNSTYSNARIEYNTPSNYNFFDVDNNEKPSAAIKTTDSDTNKQSMSFSFIQQNANSNFANQTVNTATKSQETTSANREAELNIERLMREEASPKIELEKKTKKQNKIFFGLSIASACVFAVVLLLALFGKVDIFNFSVRDVYYGDKSIENIGDYETVVVTDNKWTVKFDSSKKEKDQAIEYIKKDSKNQKDKCSNDKVKKIESEIESKYGIVAVNFCELDLEFAKEIEKMIETVHKEFPIIETELTNLTLHNSEFDAVLASFNAAQLFAKSTSFTGYPQIYKMSISLSAQKFLDPSLSESIKIQVRSGHFPSGATRTSVVAHEFGHYLSFLAELNNSNLSELTLITRRNFRSYSRLINESNEGVFSLKMLKEAYNNYKKSGNNEYDNLEAFRASISGYAAAEDDEGNPLYDETIAEAFHDYYVNRSQANPTSLEIMKVLKKYLKNKNKG